MLAINELTDPDHIKTEIRNLKRTIRYAKLAQHALDSIEKNGYYEGRVKVINKNHRGTYYSVSTMNMKKEVATDRELAPDFKDIDVELGPFIRIQHGGTPLLAADVYMIGTIWKEKGVRGFIHDKVRVGRIRYKKSGFSLELFNLYRSDGVFNMYEKYTTEKSKVTLESIAGAMAKAIVSKNDTQFYLTMEKKVSVWLMKEGKAEEFATNLLKIAKIAEIMEGKNQ